MACPSPHTRPEYIRLIAEGRYSDAYMINWRSNVFSGISAAPATPPCEPACRRGRVEETPVAICRLKRVAADFKDDIRGRLPKPMMRTASAWPSSAAARLARGRPRSGSARLPLHRVRPDPKAGGMMRRRFRNSACRLGGGRGNRLHLNLGIEFQGGKRIDSMKSLLAQNFDAIFVGSGARAAASSTSPPQGSRQEHPHRHRLAVQRLVRHITAINKRVIVLGGGNTAMDCCRTARRLGGEDVKVIVRSGFEEMKASPWKGRRHPRDIPILNFMVPKEFTHDNGKLTACCSRR